MSKCRRINDILSIHKEIVSNGCSVNQRPYETNVLHQLQGQVDSLIPLLYLHNNSLEDTMAGAIDILTTSIAKFEGSSRLLLDHHASNGDLHMKLQQFIHGCQCACTANLYWGLVSLSLASSLLD